MLVLLNLKIALTYLIDVITYTFKERRNVGKNIVEDTKKSKFLCFGSNRNGSDISLDLN